MTFAVASVCLYLSLYACLDCYLPVDSEKDDKMLAEGVSRFLEDLSMDPTGRPVLILAWKFKAATQCEFQRDEFVGGMASLG